MCFPAKFGEFLRTSFLTEHLRWLILHFRWLLLYVFKKVLFNSYFATLLWRTNNFFFLTHRLMHAETWHAWSQEQYFSKHRFLDICRCAFNTNIHHYTFYILYLVDLRQCLVHLCCIYMTYFSFSASFHCI